MKSIWVGISTYGDGTIMYAEWSNSKNADWTPGLEEIIECSPSIYLKPGDTAYVVAIDGTRLADHVTTNMDTANMMIKDFGGEKTIAIEARYRKAA